MFGGRCACAAQIGPPATGSRGRNRGRRPRHGTDVSVHSGLPVRGDDPQHSRRVAGDDGVGGTSRVTTLPAPTMACSPMTTLERIVAPDPIDAPVCTSVGSTFQSCSVWSSPVGGRRPRIRVVDEHHAVADEDMVLDRDALADERVARDLAAPADRRVLLNLDERADLGLVADRAAVEVDELRRA